MTLDQLRIFITVAELQHVTRAAERLNMTQSSVSNAISTMEARHRITLFHRVGRRIELTTEGAQFLGHARSVVAQARSAEAMLADLAGVQGGSLAIFASQTIANFWLPARLTAYLERYPGIDLRVEIGNTAECVAAVDRGDAEFGFIEGEVDLPSLIMSDIARDRLVLVVGSQHPWATLPPTLPDDLLGTQWVLREAGSGTRSSFEQALQGYGFALRELNVALELPSNEAICSAMAASRMATVMSESAVSAGIEAGRLVKLPLDFGHRAYRLVQHRQRRFTRAALAFIDMLPPAVSQ